MLKLMHLRVYRAYPFFIDQAENIYRYSRAEIIDDERAHFLSEVERISKLMLGEQ